jgi:hypothetical protein
MGIRCARRHSRSRRHLSRNPFYALPRVAGATHRQRMGFLFRRNATENGEGVEAERLPGWQKGNIVETRGFIGQSVQAPGILQG